MLMEGGEIKSVNSELWHACAGPRVSLPSVGNLVVYFPQGHNEQVAASTLKEVDGHIPNYPNIQSQLVCQLHNVTLHADIETDEVFAQMTLQPVHDREKDLFLPSDVGTENSSQPTDFFCKTLTASDTSTHGGFSVPRRAAEKVFPPLDFTKQTPAQELHTKDLHGNQWTFRHIFRGQPKRHLLTTGWSVFVSTKRLVAGDSVLFIRDDKGQLLLGIRRANSRQPSVLPSSVLSSDSMHIGVLAAAAHAAATNSRFQVFYNPRTSPSEFVIPWSKYRKAVYFTHMSVGMRFRMVYETEESTLRRYMGTITGIGDLDPTRWPRSKWRNLEVGWDESGAGERPRRVSLWEIEPVSTPFFICPSFVLGPKRPFHQGDDSELNENMRRSLWLRDENDRSSDLTPTFQTTSGDSSWLYLQRPNLIKTEMYDLALQDMMAMDASKVLQQQQLLLSQQGQFMIQKEPSWHQTNNVHPQQTMSQQPQTSPVTISPPLVSLNQQQIIPRTVLTQKSPLTTPPMTLMPSLSYQHASPQLQFQSQLASLQSHPLSPLQSKSSPIQSKSSPIQSQSSPIQSKSSPIQFKSSPTHSMASQDTHKAMPLVCHQQTSHLSEIPAHLSQISYVQTQVPIISNAKFPESEVGFGSTSNANSNTSFSYQSMFRRGTVGPSNIEEDAGKLLLQAQKHAYAQHPWSEAQQHMMQVEPKSESQQFHQSQELFSSLPQIETSLQGNSFQLRESSVLSNIQIGQSDTSSSTVTSCFPPESLETENPLVLPTSASFRTRFNDNNDNNANKKVGQCHETVIRSFSSSSGSFTSATPDGNRMNAANGVLDEAALNSPQVVAPVRTFTKVQKAGSVGRSIDLSRLNNYDELRRELAQMFNIEGQLEDPHRSCWQLVFVDTDGDTLLVGDDPWDEFVSCVRVIKIQ